MIHFNFIMNVTYISRYSELPGRLCPGELVSVSGGKRLHHASGSGF